MNCKKIIRSQAKRSRGYHGCVDRYQRDPVLQQSQTAAGADRNPDDFWDLRGWDHYNQAHPDLVAMFGGTPGVTEAEVIDRIVGERKKENTYQEVLPDGTTIDAHLKL